MPRVAGRAGADGAVLLVRLADGVTRSAAADRRRRSFQGDQRVRPPIDTSRMEILGELHLTVAERLLAVDGGPRRGGVPAAQELPPGHGTKLFMASIRRERPN